MKRVPLMITQQMTSKMNNLLERYNRQSKLRETRLRNYDLLVSQHQSGVAQLEVVMNDQRIIENSMEAIKKVKPLLAANSIEQCESLANTALSVIFGTNATLKYSTEDGKFVIDEGDFETDLRTGNGGGYQAVISFIFNVFLLMKMKKRLFLVFDEHFMQISKMYFDNFFGFLQQLSKDLKIDILMITHDERIEDSMVDNIYFMEHGKSRKLK